METSDGIPPGRNGIARNAAALQTIPGNTMRTSNLNSMSAASPRWKCPKPCSILRKRDSYSLRIEVKTERSGGSFTVETSVGLLRQHQPTQHPCPAAEQWWDYI